MTQDESTTKTIDAITTATTTTRRRFLQLAGAGGAAAIATSFPSPAVWAAKTIKIGYVSPRTGPLAIFAEPDDFTMAQVKKVVGEGLKLSGRTVPIEILYRDSQSNPSRAAEVAAQLIMGDKVDLMLASSTPDTTNPVADQCELNETPCVTNDTPWQPHFFGRGGKPDKGFDWTYHFFWGLEDIIAVFNDMWLKTPTNKMVGALWPNDPDGNAWGDAKMGFPPVLDKNGFKLVDTGRFQSMTGDFSAQITAFKKAGVEIVTGVVIPPDFTQFWSQAAQQGFKPKIVTVAKASEFPAPVEGLGPLGNGLSVEVWWSPVHPFHSSMTGQSSAELAAEYTKATGRPWTMPLGFKHSLFEVGLDVLKRSDGGNAAAVRDAIAATNLASVVGPVNFKTGPVKNISKTPLVGGQWVRKGKDLSLEIVTNSVAPAIPVTGTLAPIAG